VSRRRVLEAMFILLEFPSPSRRIFIGSHSLPPSLVRRIGPSVSQLLDAGFEVLFRPGGSRILDSRGDLVCIVIPEGQVF
jgi:hypothetical protein